MTRPVRILSGTGLAMFGLYQLHVAVRQHALYHGSLDADLWEWPIMLGLGGVALGWYILRSPESPR